MCERERKRTRVRCLHIYIEVSKESAKRAGKYFLSKLHVGCGEHAAAGRLLVHEEGYYACR